MEFSSPRASFHRFRGLGPFFSFTVFCLLFSPASFRSNGFPVSPSLCPTDVCFQSFPLLLPSVVFPALYVLMPPEFLPLSPPPPRQDPPLAISCAIIIQIVVLYIPLIFYSRCSHPFSHLRFQVFSAMSFQKTCPVCSNDPSGTLCPFSLRLLLSRLAVLRRALPVF